MKRTFSRVASVALVAVLVGGCDSFLDVNEDPNNPVDARVDVTFPALVAGVIHGVYYADEPLWGAEWVQQFAFNSTTRQYDEIQIYEVQDNSPNGSWNFIYAGVLNEAKITMKKTDPETDAAYWGLARFLSAWTWATATDFWGPIPFTEALDPAVPTPTYDDQQVVYESVMQWFDDAIDAIERAQGSSTMRKPGAGDLLFEGDLGRWIELANHVKARQALRLSTASWTTPQAQAQIALDALTGGLDGVADDVYFEYPGGEDARNPLYIFEDNWEDFKISDRTLGWLQERNDPRLPMIVEPALLDGEYRSIPAGGVDEPDSLISSLNDYYVAEDADLLVASYSEAKFIEAEARLILTGAAAADAPYRAAIRASMERLGVAESDIGAYVAARPPLSSVANPLAEIMREKFIALFLTPEPWHDWRRTGYPVTTPVAGAVIDGVPIRIRTPADELSNNQANVLATGINPGLQGMLYAGPDVWWGN